MRKCVYILKHVVLLLLAAGVFLGMRRVFGGQAAGGFPKVFRETYGPSLFVQTGTLSLALATLMILILIMAFVAFHRMGTSISRHPPISGLLFGFSIALLWGFGFLEMGGIVPSEAPLRHLKSALRDGTMWTITGVAAGFLFPNVSPGAGRRGGHEWLVVPLVAIAFAVFHGAQYSFLLTGIPSTPWRPLGVLVLLGTGASIGWMYWLFRPALASLPWIQRIACFTFLGFGANWVLYTNFYSLFLDWPILEVMARCGIDLAAVLLALWIFEQAVHPRLATAPGLP